jgi:hypothetical protein
MCLIAIVACAVAPFAANPSDREFVFVVFVAAMVILFPVHLAIEGNRRDDLEAGAARPVEETTPHRVSDSSLSDH